MNYFGEQEQAISENVYRQLMKMMEVVPEDRRDGLYMYVHLDKEVGMNGLVCVNFSGSFFELENGRSKPHYFHPSINVGDVYVINLIYDIIASTDKIIEKRNIYGRNYNARNWAWICMEFI